MRFHSSIAIVLLYASSSYAFTPQQQRFSSSYVPTSASSSSTSCLYSTVEQAAAQGVVTHVETARAAPATAAVTALSAEEINARLAKNLEKLREKDRKSPQLKKDVSYVRFRIRIVSFH
jgi:hypothetical protein